MFFFGYQRVLYKTTCRLLVYYYVLEIPWALRIEVIWSMDESPLIVHPYTLLHYLHDINRILAFPWIHSALSMLLLLAR